MHQQGAAALRELLGLAAQGTQIYDPSALTLKRKFSDHIEAIVVGAACGSVHGLCLLASFQLCSGSRSMPLAGHPDGSSSRELRWVHSSHSAGRSWQATDEDPEAAEEQSP